MAKQVGNARFLELDGNEYVVLPKAEYLRLTEAAGPDALKDARAVVRAALAARLRKARQHAGLSQRELAEKLGVSQPMVAQAESGSDRIGERYARNVLKACKLPVDWVPSENAK